MKLYTKLLLCIALLLSFANAKEFVIDNTHTNVGFSIKHMMISNVKGNFNTYSGEIDFDTDKKDVLMKDVKQYSIDKNIDIEE